MKFWPPVSPHTRTRTAAISVIIAACGAGEVTGAAVGPYAIATDRVEYSAGAIGQATIRNISGATLTPGFCYRRLERREAATWIIVSTWPRPGTACTLEGITLGPNQSIRIPFEVPPTLGSGTYRIGFDQLRGPAGAMLTADQRASGSFELR